MSNVELHVSPSPLSYIHQIAVIRIIAFSNTPLTRFWSSTPADCDLHSEDQIPRFRLRRTIRDHIARELHPGNFIVSAIVDGVVAGFAVWGVPKKLWRSETLTELLYRKSVEYKNVVEDWLFPSPWMIQERYDQFHHMQEKCMERHLGPGGIDNIWYLKVLAVNPEFQRKGIGGILVNWGLKHARERNERAYLEASDFGKGLYLKLGFKVVGDLQVTEGEEGFTLPCMVWDPNIASEQTPKVG